ncbi:MAG: antitoxin VapB family protein [Nitrososphaerales archaeon]|nr:antitoxin VapB family protein [Nitrososphaerales archaeon]
MKTITISDETYRRLESMKAGRSFSETIDGLISSSVSSRIDRLLGLASFTTGTEEELANVVNEIRKRARSRNFETSS